MKKILIGIIIIVVIVIIGVLSIGKAPEDVERADVSDSMMEESDTMMEENDSMEFNEELQAKVEDYDLSSLNFKFTGYGPGKSHEGTFNGVSIANIEHNNDHITKGSITFFTQSVRTDNTTLDGHLCGENFFNCSTYPEITFYLTEVSRNSATELSVAGDLVFKGVTKQVSFPLTQDANNFSADFILDVGQFGFGAPGVDNEVRIEFSSEL